MSAPGDQLTNWQSLAAAAETGHLFLNAEAAATCSEACTTYIAKLEQHKASAMELVEVNGLGEFESGKDLRDKFSKKAFGGDNSLVDVLQSHIDVVGRMRIDFDKFFDATNQQDEMNAAALEQHGPK
ncbi:hypothetical protein [Rhodococcoides kyotonense]|uniref:Uncharacterized protein n=1 Tax=Rhodococcoides kyotonense TaxID=398843 RepID=A0A239IM50_9NOCA|nr:hypothetical protein [Rhodococcus kyotonensis]SNS94629.1 hypothetical protein SAMN05421642_107124 [Rhodococcus kyotonensis]